MARTVARRRRSDAAPLPEWIARSLPSWSTPDGDRWLHEIKYDGYRMHGWLDHGAAKLLTRTGLDWTGRLDRSGKDDALTSAPCHEWKV